MIAYCYLSGRVGFAKSQQTLPRHTIAFAHHESRQTLQKAICMFAQLHSDNKTYLVPGMINAPDRRAASEALVTWLKGWLDLLPQIKATNADGSLS